MKLSIMQPYLFAYIGYFQLINTVDTFVLYDDVNYINRGWINRNRILCNGSDQLITLPLLGASQNKLINAIDILDAPSGVQKISKSLINSYKKAPYFDMVFPLLEEILLNKERNLSAFICFSISRIMGYIGINTKLVKSSSIYQNQSLKGQYRILDICIQENADHYINPIGGKELYSHDLFNNQNIELDFIRTGSVSYQQFKNEFVPGLSIIDVLMFNSQEEIQVHLANFQLEK